jgi:four helix bundle protein
MEKGRGAAGSRGNGRIRDFTELEVWQVARKLRKTVFEITKTFPREEKYVLVSQMRRAAVSVTANIAEGYGRFFCQENIQFCRHSRASVCELRDHLSSAVDANCISHEKCRELNTDAMSVIRLLNGYIRSTQQLQKATNE